jgi:hypothetical protein
MDGAAASFWVRETTVTQDIITLAGLIQVTRASFPLLARAELFKLGAV